MLSDWSIWFVDWPSDWLSDEYQYENLSKLHPIFSRAQAILSRLNERDFEEIRTYRAPPVSVILVVEAICILFDVPPNWESGQALLHRENFFQDLEFYDKENLSQIAFRKMKQRSGINKKVFGVRPSDGPIGPVRGSSIKTRSNWRTRSKKSIASST